MERINEEKMNHLKILAETKLDIINNGKIRCSDVINEHGFYDTCKEDLERTKALESVMRAWGNSWYIAMDPIEEQLRSLTKFELYIINHSG